MSAAKSEPAPTIDHKPHAAFFRQSGWLMLGNIIAGFMSLFVHVLSKKIPESEYSIFGTMIMLTATVPTIPLQMIPAQQTARAVAMGRERQLAGILRLGWFWVSMLWLAAAVFILAEHQRIMTRWELNSPLTLWITMAAVLMNLWMPWFTGALQGRQDFFWMGWGSIFNGAGRMGVALLLVLAFGWGANGMIAGAFVGLGAWAAIAIWRTRDLAWGPSEPFDWKELMKQGVPLFLGFGACQFLFTTDAMYAKAYFSGNEMASYVAAGTLSRALLWLVLPLATVMFPKIVHATMKSEKNNLLGLVLAGTAVLAIGGAAGLCLVGPLVVKMIYTPDYVALTTKLLPWYAGAMIPLALANVLVNDLMARGRFKVVPLMVAVVVAYAFTLPAMLQRFPGHMEVALQTLGAFNLLLFGICAWFSFGSTRAKANA
jgi:O-antigen/teichoic acid export membrane protein